MTAEQQKKKKAYNNHERGLRMHPSYLNLRSAVAQAWSPLPAPATTARLREAVGTFDVASMLQAAIHHNAAGGCGSPASDSSWELL